MSFSRQASVSGLRGPSEIRPFTVCVGSPLVFPTLPATENEREKHRASRHAENSQRKRREQDGINKGDVFPWLLIVKGSIHLFIPQIFIEHNCVPGITLRHIVDANQCKRFFIQLHVLPPGKLQPLESPCVSTSPKMSSVSSTQATIQEKAKEDKNPFNLLSQSEHVTK